MSDARVRLIVVLSLTALLALNLGKWWRRRKSPMTNATPQPFEIPDTTRTRAFMARNPLFPAAFVKLLDLSNKCFARNPLDKDHREYICFWLGHTCRQDF